MAEHAGTSGYVYNNHAVGQPPSATPEQLRAFWAERMQEVEEVPADPAEFKNHQLPLARIKKIMKSDEDVRMISAEAPVLFAKACEMFILELTLRSWNHAEENKRRTLQRNDVAAAILRTDVFDFLVDIVPREDIKQEEGSQLPTGAQVAAVPPMTPGPVAVKPGQQQQQQQQMQPPPMAPQPLGMFYPYGMDPTGVMRPPMAMDPSMLYPGQFLAQPWGMQPPPGMQAPGMVPPQPGAGPTSDANSGQGGQG